MQNKRRQSLRGKFLRVTIPLIFLTVIGVFSVIELMTHQTAVNRLEQTLESMISTQSAALATPLWNLDHEQIELSLEAIITNREVVAARVYGEDGSVMHETGDTPGADDLLVLQRDIVYDAGAGPKTIGKLEFIATRRFVWEQTRLRLLIAAGIALLAVAMEIAAALFALRRIMGIPLEALLSSINKSKSGSAREQVDWDSTDELGQVISAFNQLQTQQSAYEEELREARNTLENRVAERTSELLAATTEANSARAQLIAVIETISEGFSLYDQEDRLVICNSRYQEFLRPEVGGTIEKGTRFESIVRDAAKQGLILDANDNIEQWVAERLKRHRNPGQPHLQHRKDGRWILINERKTADGGIVAVYADITELKQREQELAEKTTALEALSAQLSKYLSPQIYHSIFAGKQDVEVASKRKKLTIFFSDIADFTAAVDVLESEELTQLLNQYLTEMSKIALASGATIDKFIGDAILVFFGDPESKGIKEDATACVQMAIVMQRRMRELQLEWQNKGFDQVFELRIGITTGFCTVGNFGSEDRLDYTVVGNPVNLAARLQSQAEKGSILIASETNALVEDRVLTQEVGSIQVKGIPRPVHTYKVVGIYDDLAKQKRILHHRQNGLHLAVDRSKLDSQTKAKAIKVLEETLAMLKD